MHGHYLPPNSTGHALCRLSVQYRTIHPTLPYLTQHNHNQSRPTLSYPNLPYPTLPHLTSTNITITNPSPPHLPYTHSTPPTPSNQSNPTWQTQPQPTHSTYPDLPYPTRHPTDPIPLQTKHNLSALPFSDRSFPVLFYTPCAIIHSTEPQYMYCVYPAPKGRPTSLSVTISFIIISDLVLSRILPLLVSVPDRTCCFLWYKDCLLTQPSFLHGWKKINNHIYPHPSCWFRFLFIINPFLPRE